MNRQRLAIFAPGGIGVGAFSQGLPALGALVASLAKRFDVTFYSLAPVNPGFAPQGFRVRAPSVTVDVKGARWLDLARRFLADHLAARYDQMLSLGYPVGAFVVALSRTLRVPAAVMLLGAETADVPSIGYGHLGQPLGRRLVIETCRRADALVAVAQSQLDALARCGFARPDDHVVPIGAEATLFPFEAKPHVKPFAKPLKILNVGNLTGVKDQATLLRAFARLPPALEPRLRIVGDGSLRSELVALIRELRIDGAVELTGAVPFGEMPNHYRWADMFVLTSLSEGQNRSLTEAAMCGVLQVSTPVGHIADLGETVAVVVRAGDPQHVADRIVGIAGDPEGWGRRVRAARGWAATHDMAWTVDRLSAILEGLPAR